MYKPELGESRFRFSLMDGEGGPGGSFAGGNAVAAVMVEGPLDPACQGGARLH